MDFLITVVPILVVVFIIVKEARQTWKDGLFLTLIKLGITLLSLLLAFFLTRLLLDPAKVDLFGLGQLLADQVPGEFFKVMPETEAFIRSLPTALLAIIGFTVIFDVLRINGCKLMRKLNEKHKWSEKYLKISHEKLATMGVGALSSMLCLLTDLVVICGTLTFSGNMLYCAEAATGQEIFSSVGDVVHQLERNPVIRLANAAGAQDVFFELTRSQRDGESFSVGQELIHYSEVFVGILPVFDVLPQPGQVPTARQLRALPELLENEESLALLVSMVRSYKKDLGSSDAVLIFSSLMGTTPVRFEKYMSRLTVEEAHQDLTTVCNIAALLAERDLIPESGDYFDMNALQDPELLALVRQEVLQNENFVTFFNIETQKNSEP